MLKDKNKIDYLIQLAKNYDTITFFEMIVVNSESELLEFIELFFSYKNYHIHQYNLKERSRRELFFERMYQYCFNFEYLSVIEFLLIKHNVIKNAELLFDEIKTSLKTSKLSNYPIQQQGWIHISRVEREISKVNKLIKAQLADKKGPLNLSESFKVKLDDRHVNPDFHIEEIVTSLSLSLTLLGHQNKWFNKSGKLILPAIDVSNLEYVHEAGQINNLAIAWKKLEDTASRCILFKGNVQVREKNQLHHKEIKAGLRKSIHFLPELGAFEKLDFIAHNRLLDKYNQHFFELILTKDSKNLIVDDISQIKSIEDRLFLSNNELCTILSLSELYRTDVLKHELEFHGLRIKEWVRAYSCLIYFVEKNGGSEKGQKYTEAELIKWFVSGGLTNTKSKNFLELITFGIKSRDLYDKPLLELDDGSYFLFHSLFGGFSIFFTITSVFSELNISLESKGQDFEQFIINKLISKQINVKKFKFKRNSEEYEYDAVFILDNKVFVIECKNRNLSGWNPTRGARFKKLVDETTSQVKRLSAALISNPEVFKQHFNSDISDFEVIPLVVFGLPFSYPGRYKGVFITDASSLTQFFRERFLYSHDYEGAENRLIESKKFHKFWESETPNSDDFIKHLNNPIHLSAYSKYINIENTWLIASNSLAFTYSDFDINKKHDLDGNSL